MGRLVWIASEVGSATGFPKGMMIQQKPQLEGVIFSCVTPPGCVPPIQTKSFPLLIDAGEAVTGHGNRLSGSWPTPDVRVRDYTGNSGTPDSAPGAYA
jgi:hypothetical protein